MSTKNSIAAILGSILQETKTCKQKLDKIEQKLDKFEQKLENHKNLLNNNFNALKLQIGPIMKNEPEEQQENTIGTANRSSKTKKKKKTKIESVDTTQQTKKVKAEPPKTKKNENPTTALNDLRPGLEYTCVQTGPAHAPNFYATINVDNLIYRGEGSSKKVAKASAAKLALQFLNNPPKTITKVKTKKPKVQNPGMVLNQLYPNAIYACQDHKIGFKTTITIGEYKFSGAGSSKKVAKKAASADALAKLMTILKNPLSKQPTGSNDQSKADYIGRLVHEKFKSLMDNSVQSNFKVLAGIVMILNDDLSSCKVISVNTGTKCISGEHISLDGVTLNDMHAEILSRRGLINFFYDQLDLLACSKQNESIFTLREDGKGYKLKGGIEFHLYISTAPCGDARIFSHVDSKQEDKISNKSTRGQLRVKIEASEGTTIKNRSALQTWDGILGGENLLTMSCSDKICKWNVVGLQGALLTHFIEPIYLKSIVLGSLMHEMHLHRAVCGRIENKIKNLPTLFQLNRPLLFPLTSRQTRDVGKSPRFSVNWCVSSTKPEIIKTNTGKPECGSSNLCKRELMLRFMDILGRVFSITEIETKSLTTYSEIKQAALSYQVAKECLYEAFIKANCGKWISKPIEQDEFQLVN